MKVCVIDGMGGGIGNALIKKIKAAFQEQVEIIALGTNAIATAQMMKAGANKGASGENAVIVTVRKVDVIIGSISILLADSMSCGKQSSAQIYFATYPGSSGSNRGVC